MPEDTAAAKAVEPDKSEVPDPRGIQTGGTAVRDLVLLAVLLVALIAVINFMHPDCQYNGYLIPAVAILIGAAGVILGGTIGVYLKFPAATFAQVGVKAAGGIGGLILGWVIAATALPICSAVWSSQITIDKIPMAQPSAGNFPPYFVTALVTAQGASFRDWNERPDVLVSSNNDTSVLQFRFADTGNQVLFRVYGREVVDSTADPKDRTFRYSFLGTCQLDFQPKSDGTSGKAEPASIFATTAGKTSLQFSEAFLTTLKEMSHLSNQGAIQEKCVEGNFTSGDGRTAHSFKNPLYFSVERKKLFGSLGGDQVTLSFEKQIVSEEKLKDANVLKEVTIKSAKETAAVSSDGKTEVIGAPGSTPNPAQTSGQASPATTPPPANDQLQNAASCVKDDTIRGETLSYLGGNDLNQSLRFDLYKRWNDISCLVLTALRNDGNKLTSQNQGRAIRLLASTIINNSGTANPIYWQQNAIKRDFTQPLPSYLDAKYIQLIVGLVGVEDNYLRAEAVRFIKLLPNNQVEAQFKDRLGHIADVKSKSAQAFFAIGAAALYYNRIAEWLNVPDAQKAGVKDAATGDVAKDFAAGQAWMRDDLFNGKSAKPFLAMLLYAKAIVERELPLRDDRGRADFGQMLSALKSTSDPYPSRAQHIGQALVLTSSLAEGSSQQRDALRAIQAASEFNLVRVMDGKDPFSDIQYPLSPAPDLQPTPVALTSADKGRVLLQSADWYLASGNGKIGWIKSPKT